MPYFRNLVTYLLALVGLFLVGTVHAQNSLLEQKVTLQVEEVPFKKVLNSISKNYNIEFSYSEERIPTNQKVSLDYVDERLRVVMDDLAAQTEITYQVISGKVVLIPKGRDQSGNRVVISGYITDQASAEKLLGAHVSDLTKTYGVTTNVYGFYSLSLPPGPITVVYSYVGYRPTIARLNLKKDTVLNIELASSLELEEFEVQGNTGYDLIEDAQMSSVEFTPGDIKDLPALAGEVDVFKTVTHIPGVKFGDENTVNLFVRGGDADQNLILLDGVPLYNTYHLFGFVSIINADAMNSVKLIKGGFPARYGGRLSSVLDIRVKEGNMKKLNGEASLGLLTAQLTVEGPIKKDKTSFLISGRRTYPDLLATPIIKASNRRRGIDGDWSMNFYDIHAKVNHIFSNKDRLYLSVYSSRDNGLDRRAQTLAIDTPALVYHWEDKIRVNWSNTTGAVRWNHIYGNKLFSNVVASTSRYKFDLKQDFIYTENPAGGTPSGYKYFIDYYSDIQDYRAQAQFDYFPGSDHHIRFGTNFAYYQFRPGVYAFQNARVGVDNLRDSLSIGAREYSAYFEDDVKLNKHLRANFGMHAALYNVRKTNYTSLQPRASLRWLLNEKNSIKGSYSVMTQFLHLLTSVGSGFPTDLWVPPTDSLRPQQSWQVALGYNKNFKKDLELTVEGYYRELENLVAFRDQATFINIDESWEDNVIVGRGRSKGVEALLRRRRGKTTGWLAYTYSFTERSFDAIEEGKWIPFRYDRRHDLSINLVHRFSDRFLLSASWVYATGVAVTLPEGEYDPLLPSQQSFFFSNVYIYGERNSSRLPDYHRLDLGASFVKQKEWGERTFNLSVYNAYNRPNPFYYYIVGTEQGGKQIELLNLFPIIPSFRYAIKF